MPTLRPPSSEVLARSLTGAGQYDKLIGAERQPQEMENLPALVFQPDAKCDILSHLFIKRLTQLPYQ